MPFRCLLAALVAAALISLAPAVSAESGVESETNTRFLSLPGVELSISLNAPESLQEADEVQFEVSVKDGGKRQLEWQSVRLELSDGSALAPTAVAFPGSSPQDGWAKGTLSFAVEPGLTGRVTLRIPKEGREGAAARLIWDLPQPDGAPSAGGS